MLYMPFSRQPDFFDSETASAIIQLKKGKLVATYLVNGQYYYLSLDAKTYHHRIGERVQVIYALGKPLQVKMNKTWGYWLIPAELVGSFSVFFILLAAAFATTYRPHPKSMEQQISTEKEAKSKYQ